jgi:hypothetical protein
MTLPSKTLALGLVVLASFGASAAKPSSVTLDSAGAKKVFAATADRGSKHTAGHPAGGATFECKSASACAVTLYPDTKLPTGNRLAGLPSSWPKFDATKRTSFKLAPATCLKIFKAMGSRAYETSEAGIVRSLGFWSAGAVVTAIGDSKVPASAKHAVCDVTIFKVPK